MEFSTFLEDRIAYFEPLAFAKEIFFETNIQPELFIMINRIELQRIIDNNVTNAIKYSHPKSTILITLLEDGNDIVFKIKDQGIGIKEVDKIFDRHYRGDIVKGGFGIGLNIVKSICEKYGIKINVESEENQGSCFIYTFKQREELPS